jgi:uncharacterized protein (TIGR03089 family)
VSTPEQLFSDLLAARPANPFVTYYDEATGERSELSAKSLANWVAKTHHLLGTELGLGAGDTALLRLPLHWISLAPLLGCLTAGLELVTDGPADVAFVAAGTAAAADEPVDAPDVYAIAPQRAAAGLGADPPAGANDYVTSVRPHADTWPSVRFGAGPDDPCFGGLTRAEVAAAAAERAAELGWMPGARLLVTRPWRTARDWIDTVLAPLAVQGSVVYVASATDDVLARRAEQERVTARV